jgi:hypothetical protein
MIMQVKDHTSRSNITHALRLPNKWRLQERTVLLLLVRWDTETMDHIDVNFHGHKIIMLTSRYIHI